MPSEGARERRGGGGRGKKEVKEDENKGCGVEGERETGHGGEGGKRGRRGEGGEEGGD